MSVLVRAEGLWRQGREGDKKAPGAYCTAFAKSRNPRVYLSAYSGSFQHVSTLAHELGHAFHSWVSSPYTPSHPTPGTFTVCYARLITRTHTRTHARTHAHTHTHTCTHAHELVVGGSKDGSLKLEACKGHDQAVGAKGLKGLGRGLKALWRIRHWSRAKGVRHWSRAKGVVMERR